MAVCSFESVLGNLLYVRVYGILEWLRLEKNTGAFIESPYLTPKEVASAFNITGWVSGEVGVLSADMNFEYDGVARITINVIEETTVVSMVRPPSNKYLISEKRGI